MKSPYPWIAAAAVLSLWACAARGADTVPNDGVKAVGSVAVAPKEPILPALSRISWAAVIAGAFAALAAHMTFSALGIGIGAASVDPQDRRNPIAGVPTMLLIWMFVSGLLALFIGGWVSGRLSGTIPFDSAMHGLITWSFATVAMFVLAGTSAGYVVGGAFKLLGAGVSGAAHAAAAIVPEAAGMAKDAVAANVPSLDWSGIKREAKQMLRQNVKGEGKAGGFAEDDLGELLQKAYGAVRDGLGAEERQELVEVFAAKANVSKDDANRAIEKWEKSYRDAKQKYQQAVAQAEAAARDAGEQAKIAVSQAAIFTFFSLLLGAAVAGYAGHLGSTYVNL